jgi:hypothetical protein
MNRHIQGIISKEPDSAISLKGIQENPGLNSIFLAIKPEIKCHLLSKIK